MAGERRRVTPNEYRRAQLILPHEDLEMYQPGGFHPVNLGDTFRDSRYTIRHKLGYGGFSTVWLARDNDAQQWVSIKIKSAAASTEKLDQDSELSILKRLEKWYTDSAQQNPRPFVRLLDCFHHAGPNGTHNCLVMELLGPALSSVLECYEYRKETLRPDTVLRASCQLLDGLDFLHRAGIVHGDVSNTNVAFTCKSVIRSEENLFEALGGDPVTAPYSSTQIPWSPEWPKHLVQYTLWPGWYDSSDEDIRLLDLGLAFPLSNKVTSIAQPRDLRSPETFFMDFFDYRHDLWRAGCVIYSLYYQKWPFAALWNDDAFFIRRLIKKLGPLPDIWHSKWEVIQKQCEPADDGERQISPDPMTGTFGSRHDAIISSCNDEDGDYESDEFAESDYEALDSLLWVMEGLLQYQPEKRLSLQEAASHIRSSWTDYRRENEEQNE